MIEMLNPYASEPFSFYHNIEMLNPDTSEPFKGKVGKSSRDSLLEKELTKFVTNSSLESEMVLISLNFSNLHLVAPQLRLERG